MTQTAVIEFCQSSFIKKNIEITFLKLIKQLRIHGEMELCMPR